MPEETFQHTPTSDATKAKISAAMMGHPFYGPRTHTAETRAKLSTAMTGHVMSPEARAKLSAATMGRVMSPETRAKISATQMGHVGASWSSGARAKHSAVQMGKKQALGSHRSPEQRARIGIASTGRICSPETRAKISIASSNSSPETRAKISAALWRGGKPVSRAKRRGLGFTPLNSWFAGSERHHISLSDVIYIPKAMHDSFRHNIWTGRNMDKINVLAGQFLTEDWT